MQRSSLFSWLWLFLAAVHVVLVLEIVVFGLKEVEEVSCLSRFGVDLELGSPVEQVPPEVVAGLLVVVEALLELAVLVRA